MSNATDNVAARTASATPPAIGCPDWCIREHDWEGDGADFALDHQSAEMASPGANYSLKVFAFDWWGDGALDVGGAHVQLNLADELIEPEDVARLAVDVPRAHEAGKRTTRRLR